MLADFLSFLVVLDLTWPQVSTLWILALKEDRQNCGIPSINITSSMTTIRSMCVIYGQDKVSWEIRESPCLQKL